MFKKREGMFKKRFSVFSFLVCVWLLFSAAEAFSQPHDPLYDLCFTGKRGVAVGYYGTILVSEDAGSKWKQAPSGTKELLTSISFPDADHGWAVGEFGTILHSQDGGASWQAQPSGEADLLLE